jgi:hypothetical protein
MIDLIGWAPRWSMEHGQVSNDRRLHYKYHTTLVR